MERQTYEVGPWFFLVYSGLQSAIEINVRELNNFADRPLSLVAWASRNLLELMVWTKFSAASPLNAHAFLVETVKDFLELRTFAGKHPTEEEDPGIREALESQFKQVDELVSRIVFDSKPDKFKRVSDVAEELGFNPHFAREYKILSKYAHPTAMSLFLNDHDADKDLRAGFTRNALSYAANSLAMIQQVLHHTALKC